MKETRKRAPKLRGAGIHVRDSETLKVEDTASLTIEDGAHSTILISPTKDCTVAIHSGKGCDISIFVIQDKRASLELTNYVDSRSVVRTNCLWRYGGEGRISSILIGEGAEAHDTSVFIEDDLSELRLDSRLVHKVPNTKGDILVKGVVKGKASARLDGLIRVEKGGKGAVSFLSEHAILLDPAAHALANPQLEILNNDVNSRHSASVSRIDESKIFYCMTRGLDSKDAKKLLTEGFLSSALDRIGNENKRKEFENAIERTL